MREAGRALRALAGIAMAAAAAGCTAMPAEYAAGLSQQDPKWESAACWQLRQEAAMFTQPHFSWAAGALIGPYGIGMVAAGREHQEKQRKLFARDLHVACSSQPLPAHLAIDPSIRRSKFKAG